MTVASLWKVLDRAGAGKPIGTYELVNGKTSLTSTATQQQQQQQQPQYAPQRRANNNPYTATVQQQQQEGRNHPILNPASKRPALAVDLSIWICESLTSHALCENNTNPALHLVFSRTIKLLSLGIKLVFVIEGKRRIRAEDPSDEDKFRKRRAGTAFWKACRDCQQMLELLGVPVVRAKAEGEALCALLNQRGVVDGVISNDGDCLLFGAKTVYTKFSIENLENSNVIRYDQEDLRAVVEASDDDDKNNNNNNTNNNAANNEEMGMTLSLSRHDLIAFALLTGSDLAGNGLSKVGHKKAIRFIRKCKLDNPLSKETAAITEMKSWARAATAGQQRTATATAGDDGVEEAEESGKKTCCSRCSHPGCKRSHAKHGCELCGTGPGEPCYELSSDDKFRKSLRAKALEVVPPFEPSQVLEAYLRPNDNQMPLQLAGISSSEHVVMAPPRLQAILRLPLIIKGRDFGPSKAYVKQHVARLLARNELFRTDDPQQQQGTDGDKRQRLSRERPVPKEITRMLSQNRAPCYEVSWLVNATLTDENGEGIDGYEYSTIEPRELIEKRYPKLVESFKVAEKERKKQGDGEKERRREFLRSLLGLEADDAPPAGGEGPDGAESGDDYDGDDELQQPARKKKAVNKQMKKREGFFEQQQHKRPPPNMSPQGRRRRRDKKKKRKRRHNNNKRSDDVVNLLGLGKDWQATANNNNNEQQQQQQKLKGGGDRPSAKIPTEIVIIKTINNNNQQNQEMQHNCIERRDDEEAIEDRQRPRTDVFNPIKAAGIPSTIIVKKKKKKKKKAERQKKTQKPPPPPPLHQDGFDDVNPQQYNRAKTAHQKKTQKRDPPPPPPPLLPPPNQDGVDAGNPHQHNRAKTAHQKKTREHHHYHQRGFVNGVDEVNLQYNAAVEVEEETGAVVEERDDVADFEEDYDDGINDNITNSPPLRNGIFCQMGGLMVEITPLFCSNRYRRLQPRRLMIASGANNRAEI